MWTPTEHRFANRAGFLAACAAAGWPMVLGAPDPLGDVAVEIIGPILAPATIDEDGRPVAGEVIDAGYHVNLVWHAQPMHPAFAASQVFPTTPSRVWGLTPPAPPPAPAVPESVAAWKGKAALREAKLLIPVETAVTAAGGRVLDAWEGASTWERHGDFVLAMAAALKLSADLVDELFITADAMRG